MMFRSLVTGALLVCLIQQMEAQSSERQGKTTVSARKEGTPFACNLKAISPEERKRYDKLSTMLFTSVEERRELPDGYAFRLASAVSMASAAEWMDLESKCCPFFDFHLEREREHGAVWMRLTGRQGVKQFIREEFRF